MIESFRRWKSTLKSATKRAARTLTRAEPSIALGNVTFSDGSTFELGAGQILLLTGPNNVGKSACLREIRDYLLKGRKTGPVLNSVEVFRSGSIDSFRDIIQKASHKFEEDSYASFGGDNYPLFRIEDHYKKGFVGEPPMSLFLSYLGASERLALSEPVRRVDYDEGTRHPLHKLELDEEMEAQVRQIFFDAFGKHLLLNTLAGEKLHLNVVEPSDGTPPTTTYEYANWMRGKPRLKDQGDGVRSFVGFALSLLGQRANVVLIDEPEAFLHPPQVRRLANVLTENTMLGSQIIIATHSDEMVRALIDETSDRIVIARLTREGDFNRLKVLEPSQVVELWRDPTLRVSDILSALFHEAAILCEGDSDARFYRALMDGTRTAERDADVRFYSFGGKDRLASVARALRPLGVPLVVIADIDVMSDLGKFCTLFESLGGDASRIKADLKTINEIAKQHRKGASSNGAALALQLRQIADNVQFAREVSADVRSEIGALSRVPSAWSQIKAVGAKAFTNAAATNAFERVRGEAKLLGLLVVVEGELEGFCRSISAAKKGDWLSEVLKRDFATDPALADARIFASEIRASVKAQVGL